MRIVEARGADFEFLPSLGIAVILLTNLALLIGTLRARQLFPEPLPAPPEPAGPQSTASKTLFPCARGCSNDATVSSLTEIIAILLRVSNCRQT